MKGQPPENLTPMEVQLLQQLGLFTDEGVMVSSKKVAQTIDALLRMSDEQGYIETVRENKDSLEVSKNGKGEYSWKIKKYWGADMDQVGAASMVDEIDRDLRAKFLTPSGRDNK